MDQHDGQTNKAEQDPRRAARRQTAAAVLLAAFSLFSPAPDLRPKPVLPVKYQFVPPSEPPDVPRQGACGVVGGGGRDAPPDPSGTGRATRRQRQAAHHPFRSERAKERYLAMYRAEEALWPVPFTSVFLEGDFGRTHVRVSGPEGAPPLVLLHGVSSNSLAWKPNIAAWAQHYRVYALDHIMDGGLSVYACDLRTLQDHMVWLDGVLDALGLAQGVRIVGLSYGGWLAARYALHCPTRLQQVVLIAPAATVTQLSVQWLLRAMACVLPGTFFTRSFLRWLLADLARVAQTSEFEQVVAHALAAIRCLVRRPLVPPSVLNAAEWAQIRMPLLYLVGEHEKICDPNQALQRIRTLAPHVQSQCVADAGHDLSWVQAQSVNQQVLAFFTQPV